MCGTESVRRIVGVFLEGLGVNCVTVCGADAKPMLSRCYPMLRRCYPMLSDAMQVLSDAKPMLIRCYPMLRRCYRC